MRPVLAVIIGTPLVLISCADDAAPADSGLRDAGTAVDSSPGTDGAADSGAPDASRDAGALPPGEPFDAPAGTWTYVEVDGAVCGNGSPMGVAVNPRAGAGNLLLYFQGGGACWGGQSCFEDGRSSHVADDLGEATVLAEARSLDPSLFNREAPVLPPFATASYVYIPYCTGDLHFGTRVATYEIGGGPRELHHVGALNTDLIVARAAATWPDAPTVWAVGISAGGYGATHNWWRIKEAFPAARVDVLSDSGIPIAPAAGLWDTWRASWAPRHPPECTACDDEGLPAYLPHYASTMPADARYALLAYQQDAVIAAYFGLTGPEVAAGIVGVRDGMAVTSAQRLFEDPGAEHVLLGMPLRQVRGTTVLEWTLAFANDDPAWASIAP